MSQASTDGRSRHSLEQETCSCLAATVRFLLWATRNNEAGLAVPHQVKTEKIMKALAATIVLGTALLVATPAAADRLPSAAERAAIERVLRANSFVSWEEIELDDDGPRWEVDDARAGDGRRYDLKIDTRTLRIVRRQLDR